MIFFETQGDEGDKDRVMLNLIQLAQQEGTLKRTETEKEIRFSGIFTLKDQQPKGENER